MLLSSWILMSIKINIYFSQFFFTQSIDNWPNINLKLSVLWFFTITYDDSIIFLSFKFKAFLFSIWIDHLIFDFVCDFYNRVVEYQLANVFYIDLIAACALTLILNILTFRNKAPVSYLGAFWTSLLTFINNSVYAWLKIFKFYLIIAFGFFDIKIINCRWDKSERKWSQRYWNLIIICFCRICSPDIQQFVVLISILKIHFLNENYVFFGNSFKLNVNWLIKSRNMMWKKFYDFWLSV